MCGRFQQGIAENGPCNEKRSQFITRRMHHELTSSKIEEANENNDSGHGAEPSPIYEDTRKRLYSKAKTGLRLCGIYTAQHERRQHKQQFD
jgi:hypothetical protein